MAEHSEPKSASPKSQDPAAAAAAAEPVLPVATFTFHSTFLQSAVSHHEVEIIICNRAQVCFCYFGTQLSLRYWRRSVFLFLLFVFFLLIFFVVWAKSVRIYLFLVFFNSIYSSLNSVWRTALDEPAFIFIPLSSSGSRLGYCREKYFTNVFSVLPFFFSRRRSDLITSMPFLKKRDLTEANKWAVAPGSARSAAQSRNSPSRGIIKLVVWEKCSRAISSNFQVKKSSRCQQ